MKHLQQAAGRRHAAPIAAMTIGTTMAPSSGINVALLDGVRVALTVGGILGSLPSARPCVRRLQPEADH